MSEPEGSATSSSILYMGKLRDLKDKRVKSPLASWWWAWSSGHQLTLQILGGSSISPTLPPATETPRLLVSLPHAGSQGSLHHSILPPASTNGAAPPPSAWTHFVWSLHLSWWLLSPDLGRGGTKELRDTERGPSVLPLRQLEEGGAVSLEVKGTQFRLGGRSVRVSPGKSNHFSCLQQRQSNIGNCIHRLWSSWGPNREQWSALDPGQKLRPCLDWRGQGKSEVSQTAFCGHSVEAGTVETQPLPRKRPGTERWGTHSLVSPVAPQPLAGGPQQLTLARSQPTLEDGTQSGRDRWEVG